jgi:hypothetical protein
VAAPIVTRVTARTTAASGASLVRWDIETSG